jgi:hypothetical protein
MDPQQQPIAADVVAVNAIAPIPDAPFEPPPSYESDYDTATAAIGTLPLLHPQPSHANIHTLERELFERLETLQSKQSEEWFFVESQNNRTNMPSRPPQHGYIHPILDNIGSLGSMPMSPEMRKQSMLPQRQPTKRRRLSLGPSLQP